MKIENCIILTKEDSVLEMSVEELKQLKGNVIIDVRRLSEYISDPKAWGIPS